MLGSCPIAPVPARTEVDEEAFLATAPLPFRGFRTELPPAAASDTSCSVRAVRKAVPQEEG